MRFRRNNYLWPRFERHQYLGQRLYIMKIRLLLLLFVGGCTLGWSQVHFPQRPGGFSYAHWSSADSALILGADSIRPMRLFLITNPSDSLLLRKKSTTVNPDSSDVLLHHFTRRLYATVRDSASLGVGIAAPQVGLLRNIIWVQRFDKEGFPFEAYLNPAIVQYSKTEQCGPEGCLSIPDKRDSVFRAETILISYDRLGGEHVIEMVSGFTAVIFQHEIDHLHGILYTDHVVEDRKRQKGVEKTR